MYEGSRFCLLQTDRPRPSGAGDPRRAEWIGPRIDRGSAAGEVLRYRDRSRRGTRRGCTRDGPDRPRGSYQSCDRRLSGGISGLNSMCGIVGYIGPRKAVPIILDGLKRLEYRGYDSAGLAVLENGSSSLAVRRASGKLRNLEEALKLNPVDGPYGIGHTRWATHGRPTEENAHPHRDCHGDIVVVHNGIVENYLALKRQLTQEGHRFVTETDTEVIAHLVEKHYDGNLENAVRDAIRQLTGVFALRGVSRKDRNNIVAARSGPAGGGRGRRRIFRRRRRAGDSFAHARHVFSVRWRRRGADARWRSSHRLRRQA